MPRDRNGTFEPLIVPKKERRLDGFDDRILSLYARGMTVREIRAHLQELYGVEVSPDLISRVTDAVLEEVREWQNRPLDAVYPVVLFDALRLKIRDEGENYTSRHVLGVLGRQPSRVELKTLNAVGRGPGDLHSARRTPAWLTSAHAGEVSRWPHLGKR